MQCIRIVCACSFGKTSAVEKKLEMCHIDISAVQTLQLAKICFTVTLFPHCSVQSLPTVEWFELNGIVISRHLRYFRGVMQKYGLKAKA